ncbi:MAG: translation factor Sua5 [Paucimonas sp.]|nr:translation factor Sua5 [Paucimonas sp.]
MSAATGGAVPDPGVVSAAIAAAARLLEQGQLVAFPTETVYGLGADAENPVAVARIFEAKGRPSDHPLIVHLAPEAALDHWAREVPAEAQRLIAAFWPGPLTLILKRAPGIPGAVSGGQDTIGLRSPAHPVALALLRAFKGGQGGIAGPSANRFGHVSPTTAAHVRAEFGDAHPGIAAILEGGQSEVGIESTIVDLSRLDTAGPVLLRPGRLSSAQLAQVLGRPVLAADRAAPKASGTLDAHYAPATSLALVPSTQLEGVLRQLAARGRRVALMHYSMGAAAALPALSRAIALPAEAAAYAHDLYASLRLLDQAAAELIVVETPPADVEWEAVNDRLRRSAFDSTGVLARMLAA